MFLIEIYLLLKHGLFANMILLFKLTQSMTMPKNLRVTVEVVPLPVNPIKESSHTVFLAPLVIGLIIGPICPRTQSYIGMLPLPRSCH